MDLKNIGPTGGPVKMGETNQYYPEKSPQELGQHYLNHVSAMTVEELHLKSDIAIQLAWRDQQIASLTKELEAAKNGREEAIERDMKHFIKCQKLEAENAELKALVRLISKRLTTWRKND